MRIFLGGVGCIGKTTVGAKLAELLDYRFFDLDAEIEQFFGTSIERFRNRFITPHSYRCEASRALKHLLSQNGSGKFVIALPPSGLMSGYWNVLRKTEDAAIVVLTDRPENIVERITFNDIDSRPLQRILTDREKLVCLREVKKDMTYFARSFCRAHLSVDIAGCGPDAAAHKVRAALMPA